MPTPTIAFNDLVNPVTAQNIEASIYRVLGTLGLNHATWKSSAVVRILTSAFAIVLSALSVLQARIARSGYLELSDGDWLTVVAHYVYQVDRYEATFATGYVTLTNAAGGVYEFDPGDLIFLNPTTNKTYRNTAAVSIPAMATVTNVPVQAVEAGAGSTSGPEEISVMVTTVTGVTVKNPSSVVGQDAESDAALRVRCSAKLGSLSPMGPWDAYTYAVRNATRDDGSNLGITRTRITKDGYGGVTVYVATPTGAVVPEDLAIAQAQVAQRAEPQLVNAVVVSAAAVPIAVTYEAWIYDTSVFTDAQIQGAIKANLSAWLSGQPIGGDVITGSAGRIFLDRVGAVISGTFPDIFHVVVSAPAADVVLALNEVATLGPVTPTIHREPPVGLAAA